MTSAWALIAALPLLIWLHLVMFRGGFWRADQKLDAPVAAPREWPEVVAVVPARDEAATIAATLRSLLAQDYPGMFAIVIVDDQSGDETAEAARRAADTLGDLDRLHIIGTTDPPEHWAGKVWAMAAGLNEAQRHYPGARYILFTDADIRHDPANLRHLVGKAEADQVALVSLMVLLAHQSGWQRLLIPAFVFFFQKLYPFAWVNDPNRATAAAAGGCLLIRQDALANIGGLEAIKGDLIDDCALARAVAGRGGRLWLGLSDATRSLRPYEGIGGVWRMVARSAYSQLGHAPWALFGTVVGMLLTYLLAPIVVLSFPFHGDPNGALIALGAWALMAVAFWPTLRLYGQPAALAPMLPIAGLLYTMMTLDSARRHWLGKGGAWKGRVYTDAPRKKAG